MAPIQPSLPGVTPRPTCACLLGLSYTELVKRLLEISAKKAKKKPRTGGVGTSLVPFGGTMMGRDPSLRDISFMSSPADLAFLQGVRPTWSIGLC